MISLASSSLSTDRRCSYQPIASASSVSEAHIRANVRVVADSSPGGSWYWSNPIAAPFLGLSIPLYPPGGSRRSISHTIVSLSEAHLRYGSDAHDCCTRSEAG